jgi:hypothetical protein
MYHIICYSITRGPSHLKRQSTYLRWSPAFRDAAIVQTYDDMLYHTIVICPRSNTDVDR